MVRRRRGKGGGGGSTDQRTIMKNRKLRCDGSIWRSPIDECGSGRLALSHDRHINRSGVRKIYRVFFCPPDYLVAQSRSSNSPTQS